MDNHIGRSNVLEFYKDDDRAKPWKAVQDFFKKHKDNYTFDFKPEGLMRALVREFSSVGDIVIDPCMRHGITGVAALLEKRRFIGIEYEEGSYKRAASRLSEQFNTSFSMSMPARFDCMYASEADSDITEMVSQVEEQEDTDESAMVWNTQDIGAIVNHIEQPAMPATLPAFPHVIYAGTQRIISLNIEEKHVKIIGDVPADVGKFYKTNKPSHKRKHA